MHSLKICILFLCFCFKNNFKKHLGIYKYSRRNSLYFIVKLVGDLSFSPYSLTGESTISFPGALGPWALPLEIKYLILLCLGRLWTGSFLYSSATSKFTAEQQLIVSIEIKLDSSPFPVSLLPLGLWHYHHSTP